MNRTSRLAAVATGAVVLVGSPAATTFAFAADTRPPAATTSTPPAPHHPRVQPNGLYAVLPERVRPSSVTLAPSSTTQLYTSSGA